MPGEQSIGEKDLGLKPKIEGSNSEMTLSAIKAAKKPPSATSNETGEKKSLLGVNEQSPKGKVKIKRDSMKENCKKFRH